MCLYTQKHNAISTSVFCTVRGDSSCVKTIGRLIYYLTMKKPHHLIAVQCFKKFSRKKNTTKSSPRRDERNRPISLANPCSIDFHDQHYHNEIPSLTTEGSKVRVTLLSSLQGSRFHLAGFMVLLSSE